VKARDYERQKDKRQSVNLLDFPSSKDMEQCYHDRSPICSDAPQCTTSGFMIAQSELHADVESKGAPKENLPFSLLHDLVAAVPDSI
jgi:hypothetical protein